MQKSGSQRRERLRATRSTSGENHEVVDVLLDGGNGQLAGVKRRQPKMVALQRRQFVDCEQRARADATTRRERLALAAE